MNFLPDRDTIENIICRFSNIPNQNEKDDFWNSLKGRAMTILYGRYLEYKQWYEDASLKKKMEMNLGHFIQSIFGNLEHHTDLKIGHPSGVDCENNTPGQPKKLIEIKLDHNTTNSSSLTECINKLLKATEGTETQPLLVQVFRAKPITERHKYSNIIVTGDQYLNEHVSRDIGGMEGLISYLENHNSRICDTTKVHQDNNGSTTKNSSNMDTP